MHPGMTHVCLYAAAGRCCPPKWHHVTDDMKRMGGGVNVGSNDLAGDPQLRWLGTSPGDGGGRDSVSNDGGGESYASAASHVAFRCFLPMCSDVSGITTVMTSEEMQ